MSNKVNLGQFFTTKATWLQPQIIDFIKNSGCKSILDPFAGNGNLLEVAKNLGYEVVGADIDEKLVKKFGWKHNDSLAMISKTVRLILTNPPYLAKNSANRRKLSSYKYFEDNSFQDLYQIGLNNCLKSASYVVAIVPETLILSNLFMDRCESITILENNPFDDTDCPVVIACFSKKAIETKIYKDNKYLCKLSELKQIEPSNKYDISFNVKDGNLGLRGVDGQGINDVIRFCLPKDLGYDLEKIGVSSRAITVIQIDEKINIKKLVIDCNEILKQYREETFDILLAPFKGNNKADKRRRRMDYKTARGIVELAIERQK